jgi:hypothetical protein
VIQRAQTTRFSRVMTQVLGLRWLKRTLYVA